MWEELDTNNEAMDIAEIVCVNEIEEDGAESNPATNVISPTSTEVVSSCICCQNYNYYIRKI